MPHHLPAVLLGLLPLTALAGPAVSCALESLGQEHAIVVNAAPDALKGDWLTLGVFKIRAVLAAPPERAPWLVIETYAAARDGDDRLLSVQKLAPPYNSGEIEVVEPELGRSLRYQCGEMP